MTYRGLLLLLAASLLGGCASLTGISQDEAFSAPPPAVELTEVPFYPQEAYQCGPAALAEMLTWSGEAVSPQELEPSLYIPERRGTLQTELISQTRQRDRIPYRLKGDFDTLITELEAGNPVMVFQNLGLGWWPVWHYAVVVGYDPEKQAFILRSGKEKRLVSRLDRFRRAWDRGDRWAVVVTRPDTLPATANPQGWLSAGADMEQTGRLEAALIAYEVGREHWPEQAGFHLGLVNVLHATGDADGAEAAARRGLEEARGNHGVLWNNLAVLLAERRAWNEAEIAAEQAVASGGRFEDSFQRTLARVRCRDDADCRAAVDAAADTGDE